MRSLIITVAVLLAATHVASADYTPGRSFDYSSKTAYTDRDWNVTFYENCDLPEYASTQWLREKGERFLRFTLKNGQVGGCRSDNRFRSRALYWERAEIKQTTTLEKDHDYSLTYRVRFVKGFDNDREDFLQLHQSVSGCRGGPLVMVKFSSGYLLGATKRFFVEEVLGKWVSVRFDFNPARSYDLYLDGKKVVDNKTIHRQRACGEPHLKIGIYRPGDAEATGHRLSVMDVDKVRLVDGK
ncbi:MAG: heparin lyase I family protein [Deltaproteobacteria bacterium]|nr:heparin lyase I family protein [Deltaproteobacteria bacterium]